MWKPLAASRGWTVQLYSSNPGIDAAHYINETATLLDLPQFEASRFVYASRRLPGIG